MFLKNLHNLRGDQEGFSKDFLIVVFLKVCTFHYYLSNERKGRK